MQTYSELNLKRLREECDLDFAHYTYQRGMCSCCYGPADLPARYWRDNKVIPSDDPRYRDISYILFKNADNGGGVVTSKDTICVPSERQRRQSLSWSRSWVVYIEHSLSDEHMEKVLKCLREQLDRDYHVIRPVDHGHCIEICTDANMNEERRAQEYIMPE